MTLRSARAASDPGMQAVRDIYEALQIDAEWSTVPVEEDELDEISELLERSGAAVVRNADRIEATMPQLLAGEALSFGLAFDESPSIGAGVRVKLSLPSFPRAGGVEMFPLDLNRLEAEGPPAAHLLGTWTGAGPEEDVPGPWFTCLVPNVVLRPGVLLNLVLSMGVRANWVQAVFNRDLAEQV